MKPFGSVYMVTNVLNGMYYIGQTQKRVSTRWAIHKSEARKRPRQYFHKAIARYGESNFDWQILGLACDGESLNALESMWIALFQSNQREIGYNLTSGGEGLKNPSEATRQKMRDAARGQDLSRLHAKAGWAKGKRFTAEHKSNLSKANKGTKPSALCLQRVGEANRRRVVSPETRVKLQAAAAKANFVRWGYVA